jgi:hypothetical protein
MIATALRDMGARDAAIRRYREGAAFLRSSAQAIEAGCTDRPCADASLYRRLARVADTAAWLEAHDPAPQRHWEDC